MEFSLLDFLFPKRCVSCGAFGKYICPGCFKKVEYIEKPLCPICQRQAVGGKTHPGCQKPYSLDGLVVGARYKGAIKAAIQSVKYKWAYDIEKILVDLLAEQIWKFDLPQNTTLIPVPLHKTRQKWRGFNQAEILSKNISKKFNHPYRKFLSRIKNTRTQVGLNRAERKENVKGAFAISKNVLKSQIFGRDFILVDDVFTSGATMQEAAKILKRSGAKTVWAMAVALG